MITQEQAVASTSILTIIVGYYFWTLMQNNLLSPYLAGVPNLGNIVIVSILVSLLFGGIITVVIAIISTIISSAKEDIKSLKGVTIWIIHFTLSFLILFAIFLHIFHFVSYPFTILSYALVSGIVLYGKVKEKKRFGKYTAKDHQ